MVLSNEDYMLRTLYIIYILGPTICFVMLFYRDYADWTSGAEVVNLP